MRDLDCPHELLCVLLRLDLELLDHSGYDRVAVGEWRVLEIAGISNSGPGGTAFVNSGLLRRSVRVWKSSGKFDVMEVIAPAPCQVELVQDIENQLISVDLSGQDVVHR